MEMSAHGIALLAQWEGIREDTYKDSAGLDTIGVGHLITAEEKRTGTIIIDGAHIPYEAGLTKNQVSLLLRQDLSRFEKAVSDMVAVSLNVNQFDALVAFVFNIGIGGFEKSTLLRLLNQGNYDSVPEQLRRWNKAAGQVVQGLVNRREKEVALWLDKELVPA